MSRRRNSAIGTRAYRQRYRMPLVAQLLAGQTIPCTARRTKACLKIITKPSELVIGHTTPRSQGGTDTGLQPECRPCSDHEGGTLATTKTNPNPSREW